MFTGIIEEIGTLRGVKKGAKSAQLTISAKHVLSETKLGDSIATNGVCLTVVHMTDDTFTVDAMHQTLNHSNLSKLNQGDALNLERALKASDRLGGHIVQGHVDGLGTITEIRKDDIAYWLTIQADPHIMKYIIEKGSIAIDGVSLTVAKLHNDRFEVSIIPHTAQETTLLRKKRGDIVNLENDIIGKYTERLLKPSTSSNGIDEAFLRRHGY